MPQLQHRLNANGRMGLPECIRLWAHEPVKVVIPHGRGRDVWVRQMKSPIVPSQQPDFAVPVTLRIRFVVSQPSGNSLKG
jgi:hypothetical protein